MIQSKQDYKRYLHEDRIALGIYKSNFKSKIKNILLPDYILKFEQLLRKCEYYKNCKNSFFAKLIFMCQYHKFHILSKNLGFSIPLNVFGSGLAIVHYGTIVVNANARVGSNCRIHPSTCIGSSGGSSLAPQIGDNCYIAPGVKIFGNIIIADNIAIAANAVVNKSFLEESVLIGGVPAMKIKKIDISRIIRHINNK
jgi:serine O-acetyltransferase